MINRYKYPRTYHLPYSEGVSSDDKVLKDDSLFHNKSIVITEKMDGENTTIYPNGFHARSIDSRTSRYQSWLAAWIPQFQYLMNENEHICGEYLFAKHSIEYNNLQSFFYGFSVWNKDLCLSWDATKHRFNELGIVLVPELYIGKYDAEIVKTIAKKVINNGGEGVVVRNIDEFLYQDFSQNIAKFVRANHVQTDTHWKNSEIKQNHLIK